MTKREFYALPVPPAPELDVPAYLERIEGYSHTPYQYPNRLYSARMVDNKTLEITAYNAVDRSALWRTWQDENRVFGQSLGEDPRPSKMTIKSRRKWWREGEWYSSPETERLIRSWVNGRYWKHGIPEEKSVLKLLEWSQTEIWHKKRDERWDRIRREIDNAMVEIREPVKDFFRWVSRDVFREDHYLVYQYQKGKEETEAFCTRCSHVVTLRGAKNRKPATCPRCRAALTCISEKSLAQTRGYRKEKDAVYLQPTREGFCLRVFSMELKIKAENYQGEKLQWWEKKRYFYNFDIRKIVQRFSYEEFESSRHMQWCYGTTSPYGSAWVYPGNLKKLFAGTEWRYVPMADLMRKAGPVELERFIQNTRGNLGLEHLAKHGMWRLARDRIGRCPEGFRDARNIREAMGGLAMDEIRMLMQMDPGESEIRLYCEVRNLERVTREMLEQMIEMGFLMNINVIAGILNFTTWHRAARYIEAQRQIWPAEKRFNPAVREYEDMPARVITVATDWRDYLCDAANLGWDIKNDFVIFPKNLEMAHARSIQEMEDRKNLEMAREVKRVLTGQAIFAWESKEYLIRPPVSAGEIVAEGHTLHHCVGEYVESVAEGRSVILFVRARENPDDPLVTVEIDPESWKIRQARGARNSNPPEDVQKFLEKWKKHLEKVCEKQRERVQVA